MQKERLKNIIEALLLVADDTLSVDALEALFKKTSEVPDRAMIKAALESLSVEYAKRGIELKALAGGFRIQIKREYGEWVNRLFEERPPKYSKALLETLAIIAHRQPITRAEIEDIRGVSVSSAIIRTLEERHWVRVVGRRDVPGKPELLATSHTFLDYFNLKSLSELPAFSEIKAVDQALEHDLFGKLVAAEDEEGVSELA